MHIEQHSRIAVVGAGLMGCGIAQVFLAAGHPVSLYDPYVNVVSKAPATIRDNLRSVGGATACLERLSICSVLRDAVDGAAIVFEAAPERLEVKRGIFAELDAVAGEHVILASNTSVIPISEIAADLPEARRRHADMGGARVRMSALTPAWGGRARQRTAIAHRQRAPCTATSHHDKLVISLLKPQNRILPL